MFARTAEYNFTPKQLLDVLLMSVWLSVFNSACHCGFGALNEVEVPSKTSSRPFNPFVQTFGLVDFAVQTFSNKKQVGRIQWDLQGFDSNWQWVKNRNQK